MTCQVQIQLLLQHFEIHFYQSDEYVLAFVVDRQSSDVSSKHKVEVCLLSQNTSVSVRELLHFVLFLLLGRNFLKELRYLSE